MRPRPPGYTSEERDAMVFRMFLEMPSESFIARQLGLREHEIERALERFASRIAQLADKHWRTRILDQVDALVHCLDRLAEIDPPPLAACALRVRVAALRQSLIIASAEPAARERPAMEEPEPARACR